MLHDWEQLPLLVAEVRLQDRLDPVEVPFQLVRCDGAVGGRGEPAEQLLDQLVVVAENLAKLRKAAQAARTGRDLGTRLGHGLYLGSLV